MKASTYRVSALKVSWTRPGEGAAGPGGAITIGPAPPGLRAKALRPSGGHIRTPTERTRHMHDVNKRRGLDMAELQTQEAGLSGCHKTPPRDGGLALGPTALGQQVGIAGGK